MGEGEGGILGWLKRIALAEQNYIEGEEASEPWTRKGNRRKLPELERERQSLNIYQKEWYKKPRSLLWYKVSPSPIFLFLSSSWPPLRKHTKSHFSFLWKKETFQEQQKISSFLFSVLKQARPEWKNLPLTSSPSSSSLKFKVISIGWKQSQLEISFIPFGAGHNEKEGGMVEVGIFIVPGERESLKIRDWREERAASRRRKSQCHYHTGVHKSDSPALLKYFYVLQCLVKHPSSSCFIPLFEHLFVESRAVVHRTIPSELSL